MVRVYGISDSENSFLSFLNPYLKEIELESFEEYQDYKDNHREKRREIEEEYDEQIKEVLEIINSCYNEIRQNEYDLNKLEWDLNKKEAIVNKYWGRVQEEIRSQIASLKNKRYKLKSEISDLKKDSVEAQTDKSRLINEKREALYNFDNDIKVIFDLESNEQFRNKRQGAVGENKLIDYLCSNFKNEKTFNLINGVNFDILKEGININNSTKSETQIDHILICPKGVFFIETKFWKTDCTEEFRKKLKEQLEKINRTISSLFKNKIDSKIIKILLIGTERKIDLKDNSIASLRLDELKDYLSEQKDILTKSEIILILNEFCKYLPKDKFKNFPNYKIKMTSWFINLGKKFKKK